MTGGSSGKVTIATLGALKARGEKAVFVTAYDYATATFAERAGVDMVLIGDSAAMTMMGLPNTLGIGMDEMCVFVRSVCRALSRAFIVGDLPFLSYQPSDERAVLNAGRFIALGCDAVKCEGGARVAQRVRAMVNAGISVMGHLGLTPQSLGPLGGYRCKGSLALPPSSSRMMPSRSRKPARSLSCSRRCPRRPPRTCGSEWTSSSTASARAHMSTVNS